MKGNIYSDERCPDCGGAFKHDENNGGLFCNKHPDKFALKHFRVKFGRKSSRRFKSYDDAIRCLTGWRYKHDEKTFDPRDYSKANPLALRIQVDKWLKTKLGLSKSYYSNLDRWMNQAIKAWGADTNVKAIGYAEIEDLIMEITAGGKTKADMINCYSQFFNWLKKREGIAVPDMPVIEYELGWREIITIESQQQIISEIKQICPNKKIYIGIKWLATYVAIRPIEMWSLKEKQINVDGYFVLPPADTKEGKIKLVPMLEEDIELYRSLPRGLPEMPFFRRHKGRGVKDPGGQISKKAFYRWWKKACNNLSVEDVDLYGGTRHSTVSSMSEFYTKDELRENATQHGTNKAFERYLRSEAKPKRKIYEKIREVQGKVIPLKRKDVGQ